MESKIDYEGILKGELKKEVQSYFKDAFTENRMEAYWVMFEERNASIEAMKEAIRQALPIILKHVAERVEQKTKYVRDFKGNPIYAQQHVDKESITSQEGELLKLLGIDN